MRVKKKAGYHHGDLRQTLIAVSVDVITRQGLDALSLRALATRAGVSSGAPYHHFADRADLLAAIALEGFEQLAQAMLSHRDAAPADPIARLDPALSAASQRAYQLLREVVEDCQRAGRAPAGDSSALVLTAWSLVHGLATLWVDGALPTGRIDPAKQTPVITGLLGQMFDALGLHKTAPPS